MAFDYTNLYPDTSSNGGYTKSWNYTTVVDSIATCSASGYFNKVATRLGIGDHIVIARVDAFDTKNRTTLVEFADLFVTGISAGVVTTTNYSTIANTYTDSVAALKANLASPTFTGTPAAPTAAVDTNTTQLATTAMVLAQAAAATPIINGAAAVGTSARFARGDHVHPTDTSRQSAAGTTTNDNASAGNLGEYSESVVASGAATSLTTSTSKTVTSLTLGAGDWDACGVVSFITAASTSVTGLTVNLSGTTNTLDTTPGKLVSLSFPAVVPGAGTPAFAIPITPYRFSLSGSTTVFLVTQAFFTVSTLTAYGIIRARRVR